MWWHQCKPFSESSRISENLTIVMFCFLFVSSFAAIAHFQRALGPTIIINAMVANKAIIRPA